jgi:uncharacterized repeat protein (TIGR01451 family)
VAPEFPAVINPPVKKTIQVAATSDEGNNYVSVKYGPLYLAKPTDTSGSAYAGFGDLHLKAGSPAIDSGTTVAGITRDIDGDTRPQGTAYDRGADEFVQPRADLSITKTDGVISVKPNDALTYTIVVSNNGPSGVTGATVTDTMPAQLTGVTWTCVASVGSTCLNINGTGNISTQVNLISGGSAIFTVKATVSSTATGTLVNTASVAAPVGVVDPNAANNSATDTDTIITPQADLQITKTDGLNNVVPGQAVTYTVVASNQSPVGNPNSVTVTSTVTDTAPAGLTVNSWTCVATTGSSCPASGTGNLSGVSVTLAPAGTATFIVRATVKSTVDVTGIGRVGTTLVNAASIAAAPVGTLDPTGNNSASDTDTVALLDDFTRSGNPTNLGGNWLQTALLGASVLEVNGNQLLSVNPLNLGGATAYWNVGGGVFANRQAAAFTFANAPTNNTALMLKATGTFNTASGLRPNFVRVLYTTGGGGTIAVQTTTNGGGAYTTAGTTFAGAFATGDTMTAFVDNAGQVSVFRTTAAGVTTLLGQRTPAANALWSTGGGQIGIQLPTNNARVDNFSGGTMP